MTKKKKESVSPLTQNTNLQSNYIINKEKVQSIGFQPPTSPEEIVKLVNEQVSQEQKELGIEPNRELIRFNGCLDFITNKPMPTEYLFKNLVPANIVGAIFATGGTGKTFLSLQLAACLATGQRLGIFEPQQKRRVLFLSGEDAKEILHRRIYSIFHNIEIFQDCQEDFSKNFTAISLCGENTLLTGFDETGSNPTITDTYQWLEDSIASIRGIDVLIIDPKSRFDGLNENDNTHATFFVNSLEKLAQKYKLTILFVHHESKSTVKDGNVKSSTGRGASALRDGIRFSLSLAEISEKTAKHFGVNQHEYIECYTSKSNHARKMKTSEYFRRGDNGVLIPENLLRKRIDDQSEELVRLISESKEKITRRGLKKSESNNSELKIKIALKDLGVKSLRKEIDPIINRAIEKGMIIENNNPKYLEIRA